jgi:hypothetical protein
MPDCIEKYKRRMHSALGVYIALTIFLIIFASKATENPQIEASIIAIPMFAYIICFMVYILKVTNSLQRYRCIDCSNSFFCKRILTHDVTNIYRKKCWNCGSKKPPLYQDQTHNR